MNPERSVIGRIYSELDAAFATIQAATVWHELAHEDPQKVARRCAETTAASIRRQLLREPVSEAESRLIEVKLRALIGAAARIAGPAGAADKEGQPPKSRALHGS